jgi:hypothetical protein
MQLKPFFYAKKCWRKRSMIVLRKRRLQPPIIQSYSGKCVGISETVSGTMDGSNQVFYTLNDYEPGSINLLYNGQVLHSPNDFIESGDMDGTTNKHMLKKM